MTYVADVGKTQKEEFSETINIFSPQVKVEVTCEFKREKSRILGFIAKKHKQAVFEWSQERR